MREDAFPGPQPAAFEEPFWDGARDERLLIQQCVDCEEFVYPPRIQCPRCTGDLEWRDVEGSGTVYSYGVVHRPNRPAFFEGELPIFLAVVKLTEGPRLVSNLVDCDPGEVAIGDAVKMTFEAVTDDVTLPKFRLVNGRAPRSDT